MGPILLGIGGGRSGAGKTTVACEILRKLPGWGAIKYTKTFFYGSITDDIDILSQKGKDTRRLLDSGAGKVVWVRAPFYELPEILPMAVEMLSQLKCIVIEGNGAIEVLRPDIVIFVSGSEGKIKDGAEKILTMADIVVFDGEPPVETPQRAKKFRWDEIGEALDLVLEIIRGLEDRT